MAFSDYKNPSEITDYLKKVLFRTGGKKSDVRLYHYTSLQSALAMIEGGSMWLGSIDRMNDYLEGEFIQSTSGRTLYFSCFSKVEENLAMYKMYAPAPDGVMLSISFSTAEELLSNIPGTEEGKRLVHIVRDGSLTDEQIEVDAYWAEVCYKDLHTDTLRVGTVKNENIRHPLTVEELAGFVKLYGWEYEKEIRLCAALDKPLENNERLAIKLPSDFDRETTITFGPGFDKTSNRGLVSRLRRLGIKTGESEYDALVDLGGALPKEARASGDRIAQLEMENARLRGIIEENDWDGEYEDECEDPDYPESEWDWKSGYHELKSPEGDIIKKGKYENGHLIDGIEFNIVLKVCKGPVDHKYDYADDPNEQPVMPEELGKTELHYSEYGRYDGYFLGIMDHDEIEEKGLEFFYVVDKKVKLKGRQIEPTYTNFRTLESVLAEHEPDTLETIKTGIYKYSETNHAKFDVE